MLCSIWCSIYDFVIHHPPSYLNINISLSSLSSNLCTSFVNELNVVKYTNHIALTYLNSDNLLSESDGPCQDITDIELQTGFNPH